MYNIFLNGAALGKTVHGRMDIDRLNKYKLATWRFDGGSRNTYCAKNCAIVGKCNIDKRPNKGRLC